jgi:hypothetical protein
MKLIGIMSLKENRETVRDLLKESGIKIYSETEILGHTSESIARYGWFASPQEHPNYSTLYFAILEDADSETIYEEIARLARVEASENPIRAFLVPVEKMV